MCTSAAIFLLGNNKNNLAIVHVVQDKLLSFRTHRIFFRKLSFLFFFFFPLFFFLTLFFPPFLFSSLFLPSLFFLPPLVFCIILYKKASFSFFHFLLYYNIFF
jgi:hypothetical protein